jgi:dipeptidyl aminopeptidase/acylaminoacyl peptidase
LDQITSSLTESLKPILGVQPEVITFKAQDGTTVHARSQAQEANANKAAILFVHGAGYLQNAHY